MSRGHTVGLALVLLMGLATPLLAQDGDADSTTTWFKMFFWPSNDPVGLLIIWTLLILSMLSIGYTIRLALQYRKPLLLPDQTRSEIEGLISRKKYREAITFASKDSSYLGRLTNSALHEAANGYGAMERAIEETGDTETTRILRPIEYLNVVGNIAPMMGLFGTVYGMIRAFQKLVSTGGNPDPVQLAGGISTALVTTFWGLVVAIPALAAYALIRNKIDALTSEGMVIAEELISAFKPGSKSGTGDSRT